MTDKGGNFGEALAEPEASHDSVAPAEASAGVVPERQDRFQEPEEGYARAAPNQASASLWARVLAPLRSDAARPALRRRLVQQASD